MSRVAAIDLGTNTIRILVAEPDGAGLNQLFSDQLITRLGQGLHTEGRLLPEAIKRTAEGIGELLKRARPLRPFTLSICATSAARDASNTEELAKAVHETSGASLRVIPWEEEARLALLGARLAVGDGCARFILFDVGGGSTEYILSVDNTPAASCGTNLGVVRLAETYITKHPVADSEYNAMTVEIDREVARAFGEIGATGDETVVGTAGTVTSLAAIAMNMVEYNPGRINNFRLTADKLDEIKARLFAMTIRERSQIPSLKGGREDLIIPGVAVVQSTLRRSGRDHIVVSDYGLREGLILDMTGGYAKA